ncbi:MAG: amidase [Desulfobacterales bacterium]|nr:MAG: amidase [Desulfobacterales bacterium]
MNLSKFACYDGLGLADLIRNKEVTAKELAELVLTGVQKINPEINAVIEVYDERVEKADELLLPETPFCGVPFFLKDLGATEAGKPQEMGSLLAKGYVADTDAYLTNRFKAAGAIILGRTTTPERGLAATTESILTGATSNPWDLSRIAGGSSGGSAAAVAAGIVPLAHASDGGGSIRIPAACCGLVGLKPSRGRISAGPEADERLFGLAQEFVVSRTVRDSAAMLDAVSKPAPGDPYVIIQPRRPYFEEIGAPTGTLRIAFTVESWTGIEVNPEVADKTKGVARLCEVMGHEVEEAKPQFDLDPYFNALRVMWGSSLGFSCDMLAKLLNRPIDGDHLEPVTLKIYESSRKYSAADVIAARAALNVTRRQVGLFFQNYDLLLTPTVTQLPVPLGTIDLNHEDGIEAWEYGTAQFNAFTNLGNATGLPAISLPLCQSEDGLPIGMQFMAGFGEEALLIRVAGAFEEALSWIDRKPPVHVSS